MINNYIQVKDGVRFLRFTRSILRALNIILDTWTYWGETPTITSANDSKHSDKSLHYKDMALDLRSKDLPEYKKIKIITMLRNSLGDSFDVVEEPDHIHIEYDPKS